MACSAQKKRRAGHGDFSGQALRAADTSPVSQYFPATWADEAATVFASLFLGVNCCTLHDLMRRVQGREKSLDCRFYSN